MIKYIILLIFVLNTVNGYSQQEKKGFFNNHDFALLAGVIPQGDIDSSFIEANILIGEIMPPNKRSYSFFVGYMGLTVGLESNFKKGKNYTIAPKIGFGAALLFLNARLSMLNYFQNDKSEFRVLPEIGLSLGGKVNLTYGYGIAFKDNNLNNVSNHRLSINFLLF